MSKQANRGIYDTPSWVKDVKLQRNESGDFLLAFPPKQSLETLLQEMQRVPDYAPPAPEEVTEVLEEELLVEEEGAPTDPVAVEPPPPVMDPATPAFKREALVADDKPKFDFFSNRPTPRKPKPAESAQPVESAEPVAEIVATSPDIVVEEAVTVTEPESVIRTIDFDAALATSASTLSELRHAVFEAAVRSAEQEVSTIREALQNSKESYSSQPELRQDQSGVAVKWQHIPLTDIEVKFAVRHDASYALYFD